MKSIHFLKPWLSFLLLICAINPISSQTDTTALWQMVEEGAEAKDTLSQARAYYKLGIYFDKHDDQTRSNDYLKRAVELANALEDKRPAAIITNYLAGNYSEQGRHAEVIDLYKQAYSILVSSGDSVLAADVLMNLGGSHADLGRFDEALKYELQAIRLRESCADSSNIAFYFQQVGELFKELGQMENWKSYLFLADSLSMNEDYATHKTRIAILNDLGGYYASQKNYQEAENAYNHMYELSVIEDYSPGIAIFLSNIVPIYKEQNRYPEALESALEAYQMAEKSEHLFQMMARANLIASLYTDMQNFVEANRWYLKAESLSGGESFPKERSRTLLGLSLLREKQKDWEAAYEFLDSHLILKDSLESAEVKMKMAELETRYQTELKEKQIELLNSENKIQAQQLKIDRTITWTIVLLSFLILGIVLFLFWRSKARSRSKAIELEQKWLRSQMNPHFIFNALGSIQSFIQQRKDETASYFLSKFASLTRAILENSGKEFIPLSEEIENLTNYIEIEKMRQTLDLKFTITHQDDLELDLINIPPMLIQPFLENSIKHAFRGMQDGCTLSVDFKDENDILIIHIEDNGIGINNSGSDAGHHSMALSIFKERIKLIERRMKKPVFFKIADLGEGDQSKQGTLVVLKLPLDS